jgi:hypothetical protein
LHGFVGRLDEVDTPEMADVMRIFRKSGVIEALVFVEHSDRRSQAKR